MKKVFYMLVLFSIVIVLNSCGDSTEPKDKIVTEVKVTKFYPALNAKEVSCDTVLEVTFNADVQPTTGNISIYESNGPVLHESFSVGKDIIFENNKIIIKPKKSLKGKTSYFVIIDPMSIQTKYGISYSGININNYWTFTTAEKIIDTTQYSMTADVLWSFGETYYFNPIADSIHFIKTSNPSRYNLSADDMCFLGHFIVNLVFPTNLELNKPSSSNCEMQIIIASMVSDFQAVEITIISKKGNVLEGRFKGGSFKTHLFSGEIKNGYFKAKLD